METRNTYFIDISSGDVVPHAEEAKSVSYQIRATPEEVTKLKTLLEKNHDDEMSTFTRAHIPFREYHKDPENAQYDHSMKEIFEMIFKLGTEETRRNIKEMGVLNYNKDKNKREDIENLK
ncbi:hydrolase [Mangrovibacillus sp. Mu-81]|uniref:hydrolase n=1 Tax=Mangrovibacillus sp. Mu-81 TaxID=3121478 RepID=UPI002FE45143